LGAGALTLVGCIALTAPMQTGFLKTWLRLVAAVLLFLPAPVPNFSGYYAPAFLVLVFEAVLQRNGQVAVAGSILFGGIVAATVLAGGHAYWRHRRHSRFGAR